MVKKKKNFIQKRKSKIIARRSKNGNALLELLIAKTNQHTYANLIDLSNGKTITSVSTIKVFKQDVSKSNKEGAREVGKIIGEYCKSRSMKPAINVSDNKFHGLVKELIDSFTAVLSN